MKIGTMHTLHWPPQRTQAAVYAEGVEKFLLAERLGYWSGWTTEHHFGTDPAYLPYGQPEARFAAYDLASDPLTFLAYVAGKTDRLRLGTGVLVPLYDDPLRAAERAAMLDTLSGGRLELGIGRGGGGVREPATFGMPTDIEQARRKYHEALDIMRQAWSGGPVHLDGEFYGVRGVTVVPTPVQKPLPVYLGTSSPDSLAWAAQQGYGYCSVAGAWGPVGLARHRQVRDTYLGAAAAAGMDASGILFPHVLLLHCGETDAEAERVAHEYIRRYVYVIEAHYERQRHGGGTIGTLGPRSGVTDIDAMADAMIELNIIGSPETCARKLAAFEREAGLNYLLGMVDFGGIPFDVAAASLERFSRQVLPQFMPVDNGG